MMQTLSVGACGAGALSFDLTPGGQLRVKGGNRCLTLQQAVPEQSLPPSVFLAACTPPRSAGSEGAQVWELRDGSLASRIANQRQPAGYCLGATADNRVIPVACGGRELKWKLTPAAGATATRAPAAAGILTGLASTLVTTAATAATTTAAAVTPPVLQPVAGAVVGALVLPAAAGECHWGLPVLRSLCTRGVIVQVGHSIHASTTSKEPAQNIAGWTKHCPSLSNCYGRVVQARAYTHRSMAHPILCVSQNNLLLLPP
jgi:hypothetical protein